MTHLQITKVAGNIDRQIMLVFRNYRHLVLKVISTHQQH